MNLEILKKVDWNVLNNYINNGLIITNKHPKYDLWILNYASHTQFERVWDVYTLSCRGLVIDAEGNIIARPFKKFFNYEEYNSDDLSEIMTMEYEAFEKMDGSLGILFHYSTNNINEWIFASRGSFESEQAIEGNKMINHSIINNYLDCDYTYMFEIIYPENRIVVNYGNERKLVLLGVVNTNNGFELDYDTITHDYSVFFEVVKKYPISKLSLKTLQNSNDNNREGYVIKFSNGYRVKVKFEEYCRLHSVLTNVSNKIVWKYLKDGISFDELLDKVPDEFYNWVEKTINELRLKYRELECQYKYEFYKIYYIDGITERAKFAEEAKKTKYAGFLFAIYDNKDYSEKIWKLIKPVYSRPFKDDPDDDK